MNKETDTKKNIAIIAANIKLIIFDVDGVLTDGSIIFGHDGESLKRFNARDGMGIGLAHEAGLKTAIITGRESRIVASRSQELKIGDVYQKAQNKVIAFKEIANKYDLSFEQIAYVGDDINDLPVLSMAGLPCAVANAAEEVKDIAKLVTLNPGGHGAVREVIEYILKIQNKWDDLVAAYLNQAKQ